MPSTAFSLPESDLFASANDRKNNPLSHCAQLGKCGTECRTALHRRRASFSLQTAARHTTTARFMLNSSSIQAPTSSRHAEAERLNSLTELGPARCAEDDHIQTSADIAEFISSTGGSNPTPPTAPSPNFHPNFRISSTPAAASERKTDVRHIGPLPDAPNNSRSQSHGKN